MTMTPMLWFAVYLLYGYVQGVLAARLAREKEVSMVFACMIFAPIVSVVLVGVLLVHITHLLIAPKDR